MQYMMKVVDIVQIVESRPISKTKKFILFDEKELKKAKK